MKDKSPTIRKLYYSISETAELTGVPSHVLRYWEKEFPILSPQKGRAGNRLYQEQDLEIVLQIKALLYDKKFTIAGARAQLRGRKSSENKGEVVSDLKKGLQEILDILDNQIGA